jgi:hypothetical protein
LAKQFLHQPAALLPVGVARAVELAAEIPGPAAAANQFGVERVVQLAGEHFFFFALHRKYFF